MSKGAEEPKIIEQPPSVSFNFTEKFKAPENFNDLKIAEPVRVVLHGKVKSISQGKNYDGKKYQDFTLEMEKVELSLSKPKTIAEAKAIARERVK